MTPTLPPFWRGELATAIRENKTTTPMYIVEAGALATLLEGAGFKPTNECEASLKGQATRRARLEASPCPVTESDI
jgi:hypothetical protein